MPSRAASLFRNGRGKDWAYVVWRFSNSPTCGSCIALLHCFGPHGASGKHIQYASRFRCQILPRSMYNNSVLGYSLTAALAWIVLLKMVEWLVSAGPRQQGYSSAGR